MSSWITGVAMTAFDKLPGVDEATLVRQAAQSAMADAAVAAEQIDAVFVANVFNSAGGLGQRVLHASPYAGKPIVNLENACASGTAALLEGHAWLAAGLAERVLVIGVEVLTGRFDGLLPVGGDDPYTRQGMTLPALYALKAQHHMQRYGTTAEQFAAVSVKNRGHGALNPYARFQKPVTLEDVLASRMIAEPLTLLQCCANADGAAATVLVHERHAADVARPIRLAGSALASGRPRAEIGWDEHTLRDTAALAYRRAQVDAADVDVVEVHDAFTPGELMAYERLGFSAPGRGAADLTAGRFSLGGAGPVVNPSGGLLARGHPAGATGLAQVFEVVTQLRGQAGARQVANAKVGMTATLGGSVPQLETNACAVHILCAD